MVEAVRGRARALKGEHRLAGWLAWHIVALDRTKRLPPLRSMTGEARSEARAQTAVEMEAAGRRWASTFH